MRHAIWKWKKVQWKREEYLSLNNWAVYQMKLGEGILSIIIVCERERESYIIIPNCNNHEMLQMEMNIILLLYLNNFFEQNHALNETTHVNFTQLAIY